MSVSTTTFYGYHTPLPRLNELDPLDIMHVYGTLPGDGSGGTSTITVSLPGDFVYVLESFQARSNDSAGARAFSMQLGLGIRPDGTNTWQYAQNKTGVLDDSGNQWVNMEPFELPFLAAKGENVQMISITRNTNATTHRMYASLLRYPRDVFQRVSFSDFHLFAT